MARIFKRPDRDEYYIDIYDAHGIRRRLKGFESERLTAEMARRIEQLYDCKQAGILPPADALQWMEHQPAASLAKWAEMGLIDRNHAAVGRPLSEMVDEWLATLEAKQRDPRHNYQQTVHVRGMLADGKFTYWPDAKPDRVEVVLDRYAKENDRSARTRNARLVAFRSFARWCLKTGRTISDPTATIEKLNEEADRRVIRRPLSPDELRRLLSAADASPETVYCLTGPERALVYLVAASTGWRWSELRRLRRADFRLDDDPPMLAPPAKTQKGRREDEVPLRADEGAAPATAPAIALARQYSPGPQAPEAPCDNTKTGLLPQKKARFRTCRPNWPIVASAPIVFPVPPPTKPGKRGSRPTRLLPILRAFLVQVMGPFLIPCTHCCPNVE